MDTFYLIFISILGLVLGSFYGVIIERLPHGRNIATGRSQCDACGHQLEARDLVPIFSFLFQRARCRYCKTRLSWRYPLLECTTALSFALTYLQFGYSMETLLICSLASILIIVAWIDIDTLTIFDRFHWLILILGAIHTITTDMSFTNALLGSLVISVPLGIIAVITQGIGGGDVKLMAAAGFFLGFQNTILAFIIGVVIGGTYGVFALARKSKSMKSEIPFGPFLCIGIYTAALTGPVIIQWYLSLFQF